MLVWQGGKADSVEPLDKALSGMAAALPKLSLSMISKIRSHENRRMR
jgi:hypothetical protein